MDHVDGLVDGDDGELLYFGKQEVNCVQGGESATVVDSLQEILVTGRPELLNLLDVKGWAM